MGDHSRGHVTGPHGPARVLVAEDDPLFRLALSDNLADAGFGVIEAENGQDALTRLAADGPFACIILDWQMPVMDGLGVLQAMRERGDPTPALFLTTVSDTKVKEAALAGGAIDFVDKARGFPIVLRRLEDICRHAPAVGEVPAAEPATEPPADLARAHAAGDLILAAQPRLDLRRRRIVGIEVGVDWPRGGRMSRQPGRALASLADAPLSEAIDTWALDQALGQVARWRQAGGRPLAVAIDLGLPLMAHADLPDLLSRLLTRHGHAPRDLDLGLSEELLLDLGDRTQAVLDRLRRLGVGLSIADFGTGYSSLARLRNLPIEGLKLGPTFTRHLDEPAGSALVEAVVALGHALGMTVVADGIETEAQLVRLRAAGCDQAQGNATGGSAPIEATLNLLPMD